MNEYIVYLPITGFIAVPVEADHEDEATAKALESKVTDHHIHSLTPHVEVVHKGIYQGVLSKSFVTLMEDEEA